MKPCRVTILIVLAVAAICAAGVVSVVTLASGGGSALSLSVVPAGKDRNGNSQAEVTLTNRSRVSYGPVFHLERKPETGWKEPYWFPVSTAFYRLNALSNVLTSSAGTVRKYLLVAPAKDVPWRFVASFYEVEPTGVASTGSVFGVC